MRAFYVAALILCLSLVAATDLPFQLSETDLQLHGEALNTTGFFDGGWSTLDYGSEFRSLLQFNSRYGNAEFAFGSKATENATLGYVQGVLLLRDGIYDTSQNARFWLDGAQVMASPPTSAVLMLRATPMNPLALRTRLSPLGYGNASVVSEFVSAFQSGLSLDGLLNVSDARPAWLAANNRVTEGPFVNCSFRMQLSVSFPFLKSAAEAYTARQTNNNGDGTDAQTLHDDVFQSLGYDLYSLTPEEASALRLKIQLDGVFWSPDCNATVAVTASRFDTDSHVSRVGAYLFVTLIITIAQLVVTLKQMDATDTQSRLSKVSLITINMQAVLDSVLALFHLVNAVMFEPTFNAFLAVAFTEFALCTLFEIRYVLNISRTLRASDDSTNRANVLSLAFRLYGLHVLVFLLIISVSATVPLVLLHAFWIPQILHNYTTGTSGALRPSYVWVITATRLWAPLYFKGWAANVFHVEPSPALVLGLALFLVAQAAVLTLQDRWGPGFLVPAMLRPARYNYHRASSLVAAGADCVICMTAVPADTPPAEYMITPCDHVFHTACLEQWLSIKMECPTCRGQLPAV